MTARTGETDMSNVAKLHVSNEFKIEKGVPIPKVPYGAKKKPEKYPFLSMDVGDSFFIPGMESKIVTAYISSWRRRVGNSKKFSVRTMDGGIRVWRVA